MHVPQQKHLSCFKISKPNNKEKEINTTSNSGSSISDTLPKGNCCQNSENANKIPKLQRPMSESVKPIKKCSKQ